MVPVQAPLISAVIKARDEEANLEDCLASLRGLADEVIVVDDGSMDRTAEIAEAFGATVLTGQPHGGDINRLDVQGFLAARGQYLLRLDADERMTPGLAARLRSVAEEGRYAGVRYARRYWFFDGWLDHGGWFRSQQLGFFRADAWDRGWNCDIHSQVPVRGEILTLPADVDACMLHYDYQSVAQFVDRSLVRYARLEAAERVREGYQFSASGLAKAVARRSVGRYVLRRGYKDGARGAIVAGLLGAYEACVAAYAWDMQRRTPGE
ncbi:MAG: glycosyltransferase [Actinomycetales bacterium]|nr:glycosyltransferase [Actinomycetales bacterium]